MWGGRGLSLGSQRTWTLDVEARLGWRHTPVWHDDTGRQGGYVWLDFAEMARWRAIPNRSSATGSVGRFMEKHISAVPDAENRYAHH